MPKVTEAHVEARRNQIIAAACKCFSLNGFQQTTIRDICREAGLSAGALYGYFKTKEEIVAAMAAMGRRNTRDLLDAARTDDEAPRSLAHLLGSAIGFLDSREAERSVRLDVQLWGEGLHTPQIRDLFLKALPSACEPFAEIVREGQARGEINGDVDPDSVARVCVALCLGLTVQKAMDSEADLAACSRAMASLLNGEFSTSK